MGCISEYRKFTFFLCEQLTKKDLDNMKFLLQDLLTTREIEDVGKPGDLFVSLEQRNQLGSDNLLLLQDLLTEINRHDLVRRLNEFERKQPAKRFGDYKTATEDSRALNTPEFAKDCTTDGVVKEEVIEADLSRQCTDRWKLDSRGLNIRDHLQNCKTDVTEKEEEKSIEFSMSSELSQLSSELSELSVRSENDPGDISLEQLEFKHQEKFDWMCLKLDNGTRWFKRDYERLAAKFKKITRKDRDALHDELQSNGSPSRLLMSMLQTKYRLLLLSEFVKTLKEIGRKDIAQELMPYVTSNTK